jgi:alpha-galactosidase
MRMVLNPPPIIRLTIGIFVVTAFSSCATAATIPLESLPLTRFLQQSSKPRVDQSAGGKSLSVGGRPFPRGIGSRANSVWTLQLDGKANLFTGSVGVDDHCGGKPTIRFVVGGDDQPLWKSAYLNVGDSPEHFSIKLAGLSRVRLWAIARGDVASADADWISPVIDYAGHAPTPLSSTWAQNVGPRQAFWEWAKTPPMGWNSYQAFGASVTQAEVLSNASYMQKHLLSFGWNICVIDYRWSDADAAKHSRNGNGGPLVADAYGRLLPAPNRFPSASDGHGFQRLAARIHAMGLLFGIHVMRGIPRQSVANNTPIEGSAFHAADAANIHSTCGWCGDMYGIDGTKPAGQAYYDSIFRLYASWGVDFVKVDDISYPYSAAEIACVRETIDKTGRKMILSLSCGETPLSQAAHVVRNANMWRVSSDFWDRWTSLNHSFDLAEAWQGYGGPGHWPDFDMLPFGHLGIRCFDGESSPRDRWTRFTQDEQTTLMSLWCLESSPLMVGGNLPDLDEWTLNLLTNSDAIAIDQDPLGKPAAWAVKYRSGVSVWLKDLSSGAKAVGLFNRGDRAASASLNTQDIGLGGKYAAHDVWHKKDLGPLAESTEWSLPAHGSVLLKLTLIQHE